MKKIILLIIIVLISSACSKNQSLNILEFSEKKSKNNYAEIYKFDDNSKVYSEFSNIDYIKEDGSKIRLSTALTENLITIDEIISKMKVEVDSENDNLKWYSFNAEKNNLADIDFIIVKCSELTDNKNNNIVFGSSLDIAKKCYEEK